LQSVSGAARGAFARRQAPSRALEAVPEIEEIPLTREQIGELNRLVAEERARQANAMRQFRAREAAWMANANARQQREEKARQNEREAKQKLEDANREQYIKQLNNLKTRNISKNIREINARVAEIEAQLNGWRNNVRRLKPWSNFSASRTLKTIEKLVEQVKDKQRNAHEQVRILNRHKTRNVPKNVGRGFVLETREIAEALQALRTHHGFITRNFWRLDAPIPNLETRIAKWKANEKRAQNARARNEARARHKEEANRYLAQLNRESENKAKAATKIQSAFKGFKARRQFAGLKEAAARKRQANNAAARAREANKGVAVRAQQVNYKNWLANWEKVNRAETALMKNKNWMRIVRPAYNARKNAIAAYFKLVPAGPVYMKKSNQNRLNKAKEEINMASTRYRAAMREFENFKKVQRKKENELAAIRAETKRLLARPVKPVFNYTRATPGQKK
jgi:hypothetical protein